MKTIRTCIALLALASLLTAPRVGAEEGAAPESSPKYFLILLRPVPRLHTEAAWTEADSAKVYAHFKRLQEAAAAGKVILAGKTDEPLDVTIGLVVIRADDEAEARAFMEGDPCVEAGVMTAELRPYGLAILSK